MSTPVELDSLADVIKRYRFAYQPAIKVHRMRFR